MQRIKSTDFVEIDTVDLGINHALEELLKMAADSDDHLITEAKRAEYLAEELSKSKDPSHQREATRQRQLASSLRFEHKSRKSRTYSGG